MSEYRMSDTELPAGFQHLFRGDMSSTVASFVGGYERSDGVKIAVWHGVEDEEGNVVVETSDDRYDEDRHDYIIEVLKDGEMVESEFAEDLEEAWQTATKLMAKY